MKTTKPDEPTINLISKQPETNHLVSELTKFGTKLLEETEKPNVITFAQFEPFIPLFNMDKERYNVDSEYHRQMDTLYNTYTNTLNINWYQPTIVILSKENPQEVYFLDRRFTRVMSDHVSGQSFRATVPGAVRVGSAVTREDLLLDASVRDMMAANNTPEQMAKFKAARAVSAFINNRFIERNLNPELRDKLLVGETSDEVNRNTYTSVVELDDD